jgi:hypothetical protein
MHYKIVSYLNVRTTMLSRHFVPIERDYAKKQEAYRYQVSGTHSKRGELYIHESAT